MNDGLIQFLIVAVFIIVSMMDGAARRRRKQAQSLGSLPEPNRLSAPTDDLALARGEAPGRGVDVLSGPATRDPDSTRDADSTSDLDFARDPDSELEVWTAPQEELPQMRTPAAESGRRAGRFAESYDRPDVPSLIETPSADLQSGYLHADQAASHEKHAHEKHVEVASSDRPLPAERPHEFVPHSPKMPRKPQKELRGAQKPRDLLSGIRLGTKSSLREAIILAEVLSPPVTLRDSGWKPQF